MKKINLLRMVVCLLLSVFLFTGCTSTDDDAQNEDPKLISEIESAIDDELSETEEESDFDDSSDDGDQLSESSDDDLEDSDDEFEDEASSDGDELADSDANFGNDFGDGDEAVSVAGNNPAESDDNFDDDEASGDDDSADSEDDFGDDDFAEDDFAEDDDSFGQEVASGDGDSTDDDSFADDSFGDDDVAVSGDDFADDGFGEEDVAVSDDDFGSFDDSTNPEPVDQDVAAVESAIDEDILEPVMEQEQIQEPVVQEGASFTNLSVSSIDFKSTEGGDGVILIKTSNQAAITLRENPGQRQMVIDIPNASIPSALKRPFIMKDFGATPFAGLNAYEQENGDVVSIVVQMKQGYSLPQVQQEGNSILVLSNGATSIIAANDQVVPAPEDGGDNYVAPTATSQKGILSAANFYEFLSTNNKYYGRPLSIQASNVDIRDLINFIADESGANIILSTEVKGKISLKLRQVPWDQALVSIMKSNGLGYVREGTILRVASLKELEKIASDIQKNQESINSKSPIKVKMYSINYAEPEKLGKNIKQLLNPKTGGFTFDSRTNHLIVTDTQEVLDKVTDIIKNLDIAPKQVMIEGKIVEAQENFVQNIGVNWGSSGGVSVLQESGGPFGSPVLISPTVSMASSAQSALASAAGYFNLTIGTLKSLGNLTASLALSETDNLTKVLSSPRIIAMNKEKAEISQKSEVLTLSSTVSDGVVTNSIERTPVELKLSVTPQITNNGEVLMDFDVTREFAGAIVDTQVSARAINDRSAKSKIIVKSGETAVIGGIYDSLHSTVESGPIGFKDIPIIGWLFKSKAKDHKKNELLIFLTPKIINRG